MRMADYRPSEDTILAWDGRRTEPLHVENRETLDSYLAGLPPPAYLVMKAGSETLIHRGKTSRTDYSIHRLVGEAIDAKTRGLGVTVVYSGVCAMGRIIRNRKLEYISHDELAERRKDAEAGEEILKGIIYRASWDAGEEPVFVDVTPEDFMSAEGRKDITGMCLSNMSKGRTVWVNEKDALRELAVYGGNTFNENDTLASLVARGMQYHAPTRLLILMDRRGFLPKEVFMNRVLYRGPEDSYVIRVVTDPGRLEGEVVVTAALPERITRGGPVTKIKAASDAARSGVATVVGSGMFPMHDSDHMRTMRSRTPSPKIHNPVSSVLGMQPFGTLFVPSSLYQEVPRVEERELAAV